MNFEAMLLAQRPELKAYAVSLTKNTAEAEDLLQSTLLILWRYQHQFIPGSNFSAWSTVIMRNSFRDLLRKRARLPTHQIIDKGEDFLAQQSIEHDGDDRIELNLCLEAMQSALNANQREALSLHTIEGWDLEKIAEKQGVPVGTIKSRVFRAREILAKATGRYA